jgi:hypothetical protein
LEDVVFVEVEVLLERAAAAYEMGVLALAVVVVGAVVEGAFFASSSSRVRFLPPR